MAVLMAHKVSHCTRHSSLQPPVGAPHPLTAQQPGFAREVINLIYHAAIS